MAANEAVRLVDDDRAPGEAPAIKRGVGFLPCPECGEVECLFTLDLDDCTTLRCAECGAETDADAVTAWVGARQAELERWRKLLRWLGQAPERQERS
jgi:hypothetical protein